jgi:hypothetical protein
MDQAQLIGVLSTLLDELTGGSTPEAGWALNPDDPGLFRSLDRITAQAASAVAAGGGASIAAHVDHLRYGLELLNRWSRGENPFADANYSASWKRTAVSEEEWTALRAGLRREVDRWRTALQQPRALSSFELTGIAASVVHLAYHLGAIRQIDRATRGPAARD